jgi:predicted metalloprotease
MGMMNTMANWDKIGSRGDVEDRRGMAPVVGSISVVGIAATLILNYLSGGNLSDALPQILQSIPTENRQVLNSSDYEGEDTYEVFASTVLGSNNDMWKSVFARSNRTYSNPKLVLFRESTQSACGGATSDVGPHYCPLDKTIYLDETFFDELMNRFGAQGGDVAQAYVIAHEVGHHAQNELGIMDRARSSSSNTSSIALELQADCFAGMWAHSIKNQGVLEPNEIQEALDAAAAVGDDRIQKKVTGQINPETWTHGSSAQRVSWFTKGYNDGNLSSCDTFSR